MAETYALDLDEEILSHLANPDAWTDLRNEGFKVTLIEDPFVKEVYEWQDAHVRNHGVPATASVLADQFDVSFVEPLTAIGDLVGRLDERFVRNNGREALEAARDQYIADPLVIPDFFSKEGRRLKALLSNKGDVYGTGDFDRLRQHYHHKVKLGRGPSLGFPELDDYFYGMLGLVFILAPPKTYKSWIMLKILVENVIKGNNVCLYSLELPAAESSMRLACLLADVPWWHYLHNCISPQELSVMNEFVETLNGMGVYSIVKPPKGERTLDHLVGKARDNGSDLILIDQLQYVENVNHHPLGERNDPGEYWGVLDNARDYSDEGPIYIAHQFNREAQYADKMPPIQQAKGSSGVEETATLALGMWANKDMHRSNLVEVGSIISRNYLNASWNMQVEMGKGCNFEIVGRVEEDDEA